MSAFWTLYAVFGPPLIIPQEVRYAARVRGWNQRSGLILCAVLFHLHFMFPDFKDM
jgi:hypothetical protein